MGKWLGGLLAFVGLIALIVIGGYFLLKRPDIPYETLAAEYESAASRYVDLPGNVRMHYRVEGSSDARAPTLVLVHGFSASLHTWEPWVARLGDTYRIISLDLPGHGLTRAPAGYQANIDAYREIVDHFVRAQRLDRFVLAGSSMGGNVAWEYALAYPNRIDGLILVGASGWEDTRYTGEEPPVFRLLRSPLGPLVMQLESTPMIRQGLEASFYDPAFVTDAMVTRYARLARAPGHRDILLQMTTGRRNFATPERLIPLASLPVLILHGDTDRLVPPAHGEQFAAAIPSATLVMYENVGHIPQEEIADRSAADVRAFVDTARLRANMANAE
ncbi:MAG TPA: alpha/beta hydrolase [Terricaulis sp.]|nr:alpha/beta hydrolase [Terricaulis sp.]